VDDRAFLRKIKSYQDRFRRAPSIRELVTLTGYRTTSAVAYRLDQLQAKGLLERDPRIARSIRIVEVHHRMKKVRQNKAVEKVPRNYQPG
jgi:SOS-response transcriptional repressor LexA